MEAFDSSASDSLVLDGNAIGGLLIEVFGTEMTTATGTCASCGTVGQVAELAVYRPGSAPWCAAVHARPS